MNIAHFIAKRLSFSKNKTFTRIIVRFAIASVAISLMTMILTTAILDGFKTEIASKVYGFWGHIHITDTNINRSLEQVPMSKTEEYIDEIVAIESIAYEVPKSILGIELEGYKEESTKGGIHHIQPFAIIPGIITTKSDFGGILLKGIDKKFDWNYTSDFIIEGDTLDLLDEETEGMLVSKITSRKLSIKVGDKLIVSFIKGKSQKKKRFQVKGIYNTGLEEYDDRFAFVDLRKVQEALDWTPDQVSGIEVFLDDVDDLEVMNEYLYSLVPIELYTESIKTKLPSIFEWLKLLDINMVLILILMIIVAIINMITSLLILILERTQMIGILKALGTANWVVRKIFLYNAGYIILFGLLIGNIMGLTACWLQSEFQLVKLDEANYYLDYAPILITPYKILLLNLLCFCITLIFLLIPTFLVTKITPIKALKFS